MAAARDGLADADLHRAARRCLAAAREALPRLGVDDDVLSAVDDFAERSVEAGRCPADSLLDRLARTGPAGLLDEEPLCTPTRLSTRTR
jgi:glutamate--cysteine ligase